MASIEVGSLITDRLICIMSKETVSEAAKLMRKNFASSLLVTEKDKYIGIVTERDITNKVVAEERYPGDIEVKEIMSTPLITIDQSESIEKAAKLMRKKDVRRLVVTEGDNMVGIITETDFAEKLITLF